MPGHEAIVVLSVEGCCYLLAQFAGFDTCSYPNYHLQIFIGAGRYEILIIDCRSLDWDIII